MASRQKIRQKKSRKRKATPNATKQNINLAHTLSQHEALALKTAEERRKEFVERLSVKTTGSGIQPFKELMQESYSLFGSMLDDITLDPPLACKRGCIYCCINQVSLTEPEALYLGFHLLETRSPEELQILKDRTKKLLTELKGKSRQEIGMERHLHPCLFMEGETCSIYAARPFVCRGWNSVNADMCKHSNQTGDALAPIENHPLPRIIADSIQVGILNGAKETGLETGYLLLPRAVYLLLESGAENIEDLTENWLNGKAFFTSNITI
ncbi:YkgJ family cysteine cluster protein [Maridesulfovibrio sp.]|uniref:YkgJ family cysteine cluster protein n=1 Tax=Maridesulfovibrio sp. TaxID=2795000 RepID=UPI002A18E11C|nr:YkgJ family cysteine cluster protein [Maridesulfovibrio sp.]